MPTSISFAGSMVTKQSSNSIYTRPQKKQKMSITQTYFLAHSARGKLSKEAARPDHNLRLLVGHANMLDTLMLDLANAEQEQERWFNKTVSGARDEEEEPEHVHIETVSQESEADWEAEDADTSDDESEQEEEEQEQISFKTESTTSSTTVTTTELELDSEDDDETDGDLVLVRTHSRHSPPALASDSDSDSEDDHMPPSPPQLTIDTLSEKQRQAIATTSYYDVKDATALSPMESEAFVHEGFFLPSRQQPTIIAAY